MLKLKRENDKIVAVDQNDQTVGQISLQEIQFIAKGVERSYKGFVKRVRILWVNHKDTNKVRYNLIIYQ